MNERTIKTERVFDGRLIKVDVAQVELESGLRSRREIVRHPGAVGVLGWRQDGLFVLVRQYRKAIEQDLLEIVAGTKDPAESPASCAVREMKEETGYGVKMLTHMGYLHMAPGFCNEQIDIFFAELEDSPDAVDTDEDEKVDVVLLRRCEIETMMERAEIHDGKTMAAWFMALNMNMKCFREQENL